MGVINLQVGLGAEGAMGGCGQGDEGGGQGMERAITFLTMLAQVSKKR